MKPYNYRNCKSLFGYAYNVHLRSGGVCQLCGCGGEALTFDLWRQLTVEHLIGKTQGGYLKDIRRSVAERFPELDPQAREHLVSSIDAANTVTACSFCNSTTSQAQWTESMHELIQRAPDDPATAQAFVAASLAKVLEKKRAEVQWKLASVNDAFAQQVLPAIQSNRNRAS